MYQNLYDIQVKNDVDFPFLFGFYIIDLCILKDIGRHHK
jgi:hypothetical protein